MLNFSDDEDLFKDNPFLDLFKKEKEKEKDFDFLFKKEENFKSLFEEKKFINPLLILILLNHLKIVLFLKIFLL